MAITGEFIADFSSFIRGTREAVAEIVNLEAKSGDLGKSWEAALTSINFEKLFKDPANEATKAAEAFTGALPPMGQAAVAAAGMIVGLGTAMYNMASIAADSAAKIGDMATKTGLAVPEVSRLSNAAIVAGSDIDKLSNYVWTMQKRMETHPTAFAEGLKQLGINAQDFAKMGFDERLLAVGNALKTADSHMVVVNASTKLLGAQAREAVPTLTDLGDAMGKVGEIEPWTQEDAENAREFKQQVAALKLEFQGLAQELGSAVMPSVTAFIAAFREDFLGPARERIQSTKREIEALTSAWDLLVGNVDRGKVQVTDAGKAMEEYWRANQERGQAVVDISDIVTQALADEKEAMMQDAEAARRAEADTRKFAAAMVELNSTGEGWKGTLDTINGSTVEAIKYYLEAGVSQGALATAYGLTATQVKAVATAMSEEKAAIEEQIRKVKELEAIEDRHIKATTQLWLDYEKTVRSASDNTVQAQIDNAWRAADAQIAAMSNAGTLTTETYDLIMRKAQATADNIVAKTLEQDQYSRTHYEQLATEAQAAYDFALTHAEEYTQGRIEQLRAEAEAAKLTLLDWQAAADAVLKQTQGTAEQTRAVIEQVTSGLSQLGQFKPGQTTPGGKLPQSAVREMQDQFGNWYLGKADTGEFIQRLERKGGAGGFLGWGLPGDFGGLRHMQTQQRINALAAGPRAYGGVTINVQGNVLSTKDELARLVGDALTSSYRTGGHRLPV
jgi:uncharacterized protein (DUF433 family)